MSKPTAVVIFASLIACLSFTCKSNAPVNTDLQLSVAFYNIDNLYDTKDDTSHKDDDFTPNGKYKWDKSRYEQKIRNLNKVISLIADGNPPDILGVCELESALALSDLLKSKSLKNQYNFVHYDSPDERGVDVALIYKTSKFKVLESKNYKVVLSKDTNDRTRDILYVKGISPINNDTFNFIVCHYPSRKEGKNESEQNRLDASAQCLKIISEKISLKRQNLIVLGDFNDQPWDKSMQTVLGASSHNKFPNAQLQNLMFELPKETGSYFFRGHWERLDQIIISAALRDGKGPDYIEGSLSVLKEDWMMQKGKYEGYPLRTFGGENWLNGYSDHLPVKINIQLK